MVVMEVERHALVPEAACLFCAFILAGHGKRPLLQCPCFSGGRHACAWVGGKTIILFGFYKALLFGASWGLADKWAVSIV